MERRQLLGDYHTMLESRAAGNREELAHRETAVSCKD